MGHLSDKEILQKYKDPDSQELGFQLIIKKYQERLYWHIRRIVISHDDTDDVIQNVFIKAWKGLMNFREEAGLYTWLYRIATNEALSFLNKKKQQLFTSLDSVMHQLSESLANDIHFSGDEIQMLLQQAILSLPEKQRLVFQMKYYQEMKYEEISEILGTSVGALKASYHHAVKKIEKFISPD